MSFIPEGDSSPTEIILENEEIILDLAEKIDDHLHEHTHKVDRVPPKEDFLETLGFTIELHSELSSEDANRLSGSLLYYVESHTSRIENIREAEGDHSEIAHFIGDLTIKYQAEVQRIRKRRDIGRHFRSNIHSDIVSKENGSITLRHHIETDFSDSFVIDETLNSTLDLANQLLFHAARTVDEAEGEVSVNEGILEAINGNMDYILENTTEEGDQ
jgi:hypothetical protein